jgi:hypothetical protein
MGGNNRTAEEIEISELEEDVMYGDGSLYSYSNSFDPRRMRGIWRQYQRAAYLHSRNEDYGYFINIDISNFYDSINLDILEHRLRSHTGQKNTPIIDLLFILLRYWNRSIEGYGRKTVGLPMEEIGDNSRILANFFLQIYDETMSSYGKIIGQELKFLRFADDQILMAPDRASAESFLFFAADELRKNGLSVNSGKVHRFESRDKFDHYWLFKEFRLLDAKDEMYSLNDFAERYFTLNDSQRSDRNAAPFRIQSMFNALLYRIDSRDLSSDHRNSLLEEMFTFGLLSTLDETLILKVRSVVPRSMIDQFDEECRNLATDVRFNYFAFSLNRA